MQIQDQTQSEGENLVERFLELGVAMQGVVVWIDHSAGDDARKQEACRPDRTLGGSKGNRIRHHPLMHARWELEVVEFVVAHQQRVHEYRIEQARPLALTDHRAVVVGTAEVATDMHRLPAHRIAVPAQR